MTSRRHDDGFVRRIARSDAVLRAAARAGPAAMLVLLLAAGCAEKGRIPDGSGTFEAVEIRLAAELAGRIEELRADEGDVVAEGDTLVLLDRELLSIRRDEAEAALREGEARIEVARKERARVEVALGGAQKKFARLENLHRKKSASDQAFDDAETALHLAESAVASARATEAAARTVVDRASIALRLAEYRLSRAALLSPLAGQVTVRHRRAGELVSPGMPVLTIADLSDLWLEAYLPEPDLPRVHAGEEVEVDVDGLPNRRFVGRITWISPEAEFTPTMAQTRDARTDLVYAVKIRVSNPDGDLKIGMPGDFFLP